MRYHVHALKAETTGFMVAGCWWVACEPCAIDEEEVSVYGRLSVVCVEEEQKSSWVVSCRVGWGCLQGGG